MSRKTYNNFLNLLVLVVVIILIAAITGGAYLLLAAPSYGFSVAYGKDVITETAEYIFPSGELRFDVNYAVNLVQSGYAVKITPNKDVLLDFYIEGESYDFIGENDLTPAFDIKLFDSYFILTIPKNVKMTELLAKIYKGKDVFLVNSIEKDKLYFVLTVTSKDGSSSVNIFFGLNLLSEDTVNLDVEQIILDPSHITF